MRIADRLIGSSLITTILIIWQILSSLNIIPKFLLPSPLDVIKAFTDDIALIAHHTGYTLTESLIGLIIGVVSGFVSALFMDSFSIVKKMLYPLIIVSQTIPTVAIAPLLVLWLGYEMTPKITLIAMTTFFPISVSLMNGFSSVDTDSIQLLKAMGAGKIQIYKHVKLPFSTPHFFSGLKISVTYAIIGAVVAEWLGGFDGLGVYMTRARKSYAFDKMFAIIFFISLLSLIAMAFLSLLEKKIVKWQD